MHHIDRDTPWEEIWQAMEVLVQQGKVLYVGSSNFAGFHIARAQGEARARHFMGLVSEQCVYNLNRRMVELEILPVCRDFGLGVIPWSPLAGGLLGGILQKIDQGRRASEMVQKALETARDKVEKYEAFCAKLGQPPADVALAWLLKNPMVTAPIIGPRTIEQLEGAFKGSGTGTLEETLKALDEIWPGPGGEAPEAFAW
jgi:aryl-alcohol dehydrogenase-like predicted oxidoreductase